MEKGISIIITPNTDSQGVFTHSIQFKRLNSALRENENGQFYEPDWLLPDKVENGSISEEKLNQILEILNH